MLQHSWGVGLVFKSANGPRSYKKINCVFPNFLYFLISFWYFGSFILISFVIYSVLVFGNDIIILKFDTPVYLQLHNINYKLYDMLKDIKSSIYNLLNPFLRKNINHIIDIHNMTVFNSFKTCLCFVK